MLKFLLTLLGWLPLRLLYGIATLLAGLLHTVLRYRRKVVAQNLQRAFPEKTPAWHHKTTRLYYRYLADLVVENLKLWVWPPRAVARHSPFHPADLAMLNQLHTNGQDAIIAMGHLGNWEWAGASMAVQGAHQLYAIYRPIKNKKVDTLMQNFRTRYGGKVVAMADVPTCLRQIAGTGHATAFIADQAPPPDKAYWTNFLNQPTPFFRGVELFARRYNLPVVFAWMERPRRGQWRIRLKLLTDSPRELPRDALTEMYVREMERAIRANPAYWLWSHRRWKHTPPAAIAELPALKRET